MKHYLVYAPAKVLSAEDNSQAVEKYLRILLKDSCIACHSFERVGEVMRQEAARWPTPNLQRIVKFENVPRIK